MPLLLFSLLRVYNTLDKPFLHSARHKMSEFKPSETNIETQMHCKANESLKEDVEKDLCAEDPPKDKAKAILSGDGETNNESTEGNDGRTGVCDDPESGSTSSA